SFNASLVFNVPWDGGPIRVDLFEQGDAAGAGAASASIDLAVEAQYQAITIDTPPPGTIVGSPMVLTGRTARAPRDNLTYRVFSSAGQSIGEGSFPVFGAPGSPRDFAAELFFDYALNGDTIRAELYDWNAATGTADAAAAITLVVLPAAQRITIDTPPPGTLVGSPMVITGRTTRYPFQGDLSYRVTDAAGQQLGVGTFAVAGPVNQAASFNASPTFNIPRDGGTVHLEVFDVNPADGSIPASSTLDLDVLAQYQRITIDTPPSGTTVGSPVVITGQASRYPNHGQLSYRVVDAGGAALGTGSFSVDGAQGERGSFVASLTFAEPPDGGNIRLELRDQADDGSLIASTPLAMVVAPPPPQQIAIDTPAPGTTVGSPVVITGQTTRAPASGQLGYRVRDASGRAIGAGAFPVSPTTVRATSFNASITFVEPRGGDPIAVDIFDQSGAGGTTIASASIDLYVAPQP
ncbi:MAG TPA: Gmad2 immunoglobulin-like domain-containing protein, partial [Roseiflexaceae bacterium]